MRTLRLVTLLGFAACLLAALSSSRLVAQRGAGGAPAVPATELQTSVTDGFTMASVGDMIEADPGI